MRIRVEDGKKLYTTSQGKQLVLAADPNEASERLQAEPVFVPFNEGSEAIKTFLETGVVPEHIRHAYARPFTNVGVDR